MKKYMLKTSNICHCITLLLFIVVTTLSNFDVFSIYFFISLYSLNGSFKFFLNHLHIILFLLSIDSDIFYLTLLCHSKTISHFYDIPTPFLHIIFMGHPPAIL